MSGPGIRPGALGVAATRRCGEALGWGTLGVRVLAASAFLGDTLWWLIGLMGLLGDVGLRIALPQLLASSQLHGPGQWLWCVLWLPVLEEVTFRGILQGELLRTGWGQLRVFGLTAANVACSVLFVALHFLHHRPLWALSVLAPSLVLGWLRERHSGIASPIAMHALFNLTFFAAASLGAG